MTPIPLVCPPRSPRSAPPTSRWRRRPTPRAARTTTTADRPRFGTGHLNATLIATAALVLVVLVVAAWSLVPTLYVRPDGVRARPAPQPRQLGDDLRRAALRLTEPVTIRRR